MDEIRTTYYLIPGWHRQMTSMHEGSDGHRFTTTRSIAMVSSLLSQLYPGLFLELTVMIISKSESQWCPRSCSQGAPNSQDDKSHSSACPTRFPSPNQASSDTCNHALHTSPSSPTQTYCPCLFLDHALAGIGTSTSTVLCMNPLDLLKVKHRRAGMKAVSGAVSGAP
jgi:hypothetical protein